MEEFSVKSENRGDLVVAVITGRIDSVTAVSLDQELEKIVQENKKQCWISRM